MSFYPDIPNLTEKLIQETGIFDEPVIVQEKVDGSQFSFFVQGDGDIEFRSRRRVITPGSEGQFKQGVEAVWAARDCLMVGATYYGEYLQKPKHNTLCYGRVPRNHVALFDFRPEAEYSYPPFSCFGASSTFPFEVVPTDTIEKCSLSRLLTDYLERDSFLGGTKVEGVVVKNYARKDKWGNPLFAKLVRADFKEKNSRNRVRTPGVDIIEQLAAELRNERRWEKAVQHLRDNGEMEESPKDIGKLVKEVFADIEKEETDYIKDHLLSWALKERHLLKFCVRGLSEWYKAKLGPVVLTRDVPDDCLKEEQ